MDLIEELVPESFDGYKVIQMKFDETCKYTGQIFWKPHKISGKEQNIKKPIGRTLFILNLPSYITKESLFHIMGKFGKVRDVFLHKKPDPKAPPEVKYPLIQHKQEIKGYKVGYIVFSHPGAIEKAMEHPTKEVLIASTKENPIITGLKKWCASYNASVVDLDELKEETERILKDYEDRKASEAKSNEPDDDGWITVSHSKKRPATDTRPGNPKRKRKKKMKLINFYAFQQKEANMQHLEEKRKKFEEDAKRMTMLRKSRNFKPL